MRSVPKQKDVVPSARIAHQMIEQSTKLAELTQADKKQIKNKTQEYMKKKHFR